MTRSQIALFFVCHLLVCWLDMVARKNKSYRELCDLLTAVNSEREADMLLQDMFTPQEVEALGERWQLVQLLVKSVPQRTIAKRLGVSISTVTRGSRALQYGAGGFAHFLKKLKKAK